MLNRLLDRVADALAARLTERLNTALEALDTRADTAIAALEYAHTALSRQQAAKVLAGKGAVAPGGSNGSTGELDAITAIRSRRGF